MLIKKPSDIRSSEITDEKWYQQRRRFLKSSLALSGAALFPEWLYAGFGPGGSKLENVSKGPFSSKETPNTYEDITQYNNFYEFGTGKGDPAKNAHTLITDPWKVKITGAVEKPGEYTLEDILKPHALQERIYRFRCVEAWSMVVPWVGFPLADLIKRFSPTSNAKYVEFTTLLDPKQMPGQRRNILDWPYVEGLRMDEAMHPLSLLVVGLYGRVLPNQNGAPLRLMVPWKYGFKNVKSIVQIRFTEKQPSTTWALSAPNEYGFYANVNPTVDHPRWSQARERKIGASFFSPRQKTLMFNGYEEQVASLYSGMDLRKNF